MKSPPIGELDLFDPPIRYSFYARSGAGDTFFVVNYHTAGWWLQLEIVFTDNWGWFHRVNYEDLPVFNQNRPGVLMPKAVVSSVLRGIKHACRERGIKLMPKWMSFTNADFECYHLFERAAGHLVNHLVDNGQFGSLVIMQSKQ